MRQFLSDSYPNKNGLVFITKKDYNYLHNVLRCRVGDMISVRLPDGLLENMTVSKIDTVNKIISLQICAIKGLELKNSIFPSELKKNSVEYVLFQFIPKPAKFDLIVRQAVESGISCIVPVIGEYSQFSAELVVENRRTRLERIIREAMQQSGSCIKTRIEKALTPAQVGALWKEMLLGEGIDGVAFVLYERLNRTKSMFTSLQSQKNIKKAAIVVGCEGGISPQELSILENDGFIPVHFCTNILRCETAAIYGIAALQSFLSEL